MKGLDQNVGIVAWVGNEAKEDASLLKILWEAGCVFHVRTTEPQLLVSCLQDGKSGKDADFNLSDGN